MKSFLPLLLAAALIPSAAFADPTVAPGDTLLTVSAEGQSTRTPDIASFTAGVASTGRTAGEAMTGNAAAMTRVIAALRTAGVAERDIQTSNVSLNPTYADNARQDGPPRITGYQASNSVAVRARDLKRMGSVIDALVGAGANDINGPSFGLDQPAAAQDEARLAAMRSARARAELYAKAAGLKVLRILAISESTAYAPRPMMAMAMRAKTADITPIAAGEVDSTVTVNVQFELAP
jgi:uncharacterized protein YggE